MSGHQRAQLLISQSRFDLAEQELHQVLANDPQDAIAHVLLAICYRQTKRYKEATREAELAIQLQPDNPHSHLMLGSIFLIRNRYPEAEAAVEEALRLNPYDEDAFATMANIHFDQKHWQAALEFAEKGLEIDPDEPACLSFRSLALERLGKGDVAVDSARESLSRNPDNSNAHATHALALLNNGQHKQAQDSFREALRLDPTNKFAKQGMIRALNANNILFRLILKWYTFIGRLSGSAQWLVILGLVFGQMLLSELSEQFPAIAPFTGPILLCFFAFCVMTWIADPMFNTILRFNRYGKYLLDNRQIMSSNVMAGMGLFGLVLGIGLCVSINSGFGLLIGLGYALFMLLPISATFQCEDGYPLVIMILVSCALGFLGLGMIGMLFIGLQPPTFMLQAFILGNFGSQILANFLTNAQVRK